ncbi:hypothetical protein HID58_076316 [Brassica napus]|uniref:Uncharacterized protein n=1 Tax=Brassica napus TaxID=3708 RepID=A0ABQ7YNE5_BRANA|nr:hypothetical protein HID58_076316 [Brassica napus]
MRTSSYHGNSRGDAGGSQRRSSRREETAVATQEVRLQASPRRVEGQNGQEEIREETREEGEIKRAEEEALAPVSKEFQAALAETQAAGMEVIFDPVDGEEGLQKIQSLVVSDRAPEGEEEDGMEMDEFQAALLEHGLDAQAIDALPAVSEEEIEEMIAGYEEDDQTQEAGEHANGAEGKNKEATKHAQKQGTRKSLFKSSINVAGSTKMRNAAVLVSPRKRAAVRTGTRKGDANKQLESKGSSSLNSGNLKNEFMDQVLLVSSKQGLGCLLFKMFGFSTYFVGRGFGFDVNGVVLYSTAGAISMATTLQKHGSGYVV